MHTLEDAICLTFLSLQFAAFAQEISDADKMASIFCIVRLRVPRANIFLPLFH